MEPGTAGARIVRSMPGPSLTGTSLLLGHGGRSGLYRLHRLRRLHRLHRLESLPDVGATIARHRGWARRARTGPSVVWLLLAGAAVLAFVRVATAVGRSRRSSTERVLLVGLLLLLGLVVLSFRRSGARYR